jgi:plastocyanin
MSSKPLLAAALVALSLGLVACGSSGSDSSSSEAETTPSGQESGSAESTEGATGSEGETTESEAAPSGAASKSEKVQIVEFTYEPDPVVVQVGGKVIWQNEDSAPHTATADDGSFDTGTIDEG